VISSAVDEAAAAVRALGRSERAARRGDELRKASVDCDDCEAAWAVRFRLGCEIT
jgi:hypothetical protein